MPLHDFLAMVVVVGFIVFCCFFPILAWRIVVVRFGVLCFAKDDELVVFCSLATLLDQTAHGSGKSVVEKAIVLHLINDLSQPVKVW